MSLPENIKEEHILKAIEKIDQEGIPPNGHSSTYDVVFKQKKYPPKLVVSYANIFANGSEIVRTTFDGGLNTECFQLLEKHGFEIVKKEKSFFDTLVKFLDQAQTKELKTKHFNREYQNLKVEVSFGQGNQARIPWIALLRNGQAVSNGIYPVYLYYRDENILILAYGLSETQESNYKWDLASSAQTIKDLFVEKFHTKPDRYGKSFVYNHYNLSKSSEHFGLDATSINEDLSSLIEIYKQLPLDLDTSKKADSPISISKYESNREQKLFDLKSFISQTNAAGLNFSNRLIVRFISSLCTKPFVILTGLSGSGKTKLAQAFASWITEDDSQICIVPVGADWTNREPLLGYPNALDSSKYAAPENGALNLLIDASKEENSDKPYFLILDEMNLSHVERYFADFLSAMESHEAIPLHAEDGIKNVPSRIHLPPNLFIVGTVNIDETTYMFSPKVLDRANAIEFKVTQDEMEVYLTNTVKLDLKSLKFRGAKMASDFVKRAKAEGVESKDPVKLNDSLLVFFHELKKVGAEFGYRTASEIKRFANIVETLDANWSTDEIIDAAVMQKLLPKIHGSRRKIEPSLKALASLCLIKKNDVTNLLNNPEDIDYTDTTKIKYPISLEKILRMHRAVVHDGFTSFAEA